MGKVRGRMRSWGKNIGVLLGILTLTFFTVVIHRTNTRDLPKETDEIEQSQTTESRERTESKEKEEAELTESEETEYMESEAIVELPKLPSTGKQFSDFVPDGWKLLDSVELDFNQDGIMDQVGVLEELELHEERLSPRILFAIASDENGQYQLDFQDCNLIRARDEGGISGDPYLSLTVEDVSFTTHAKGGSNWRMSENFTYTYKEGEWYLTYSEYTWGFQHYITIVSINNWEKGIGIRKHRNDNFDEMEKHWDESEPEYDLIYEVPLDPPPTIYQASMRWRLGPRRITDWTVESVRIADGINLTEDMINFPIATFSYEYCDENVMLYTFSDESSDNTYLGKYCWQDKTLSVIAEEKSGINDVVFYKDKIYYFSYVLKPIRYKEVQDGQERIIETEQEIGVCLYRMNPDGTGRRLVFEYLLPEAGQEIWEIYPPYLSMNFEISGNKIVAEVFIGERMHPFYQMDSDGGNVQYIGGVGGQ